VRASVVYARPRRSTPTALTPTLSRKRERGNGAQAWTCAQLRKYAYSLAGKAG